MEGSSSKNDSHQEVKYSEIQADEHSDCNNYDRRKDPKSRHWITISLLFLNGLVLLLLLLSISRLNGGRSCSHTEINDVGSNLMRDDDLSIINRMATRYHYLEPGFDENDFTVGDPYWSDMFPVGDGIVFLTQEYIETRRLPQSAVSPNREGNRSVYEIAAYHSLHCLTSLRATIWNSKEALVNNKPYDIERRWLHTKHCLADLRQYVMCHFDETLLLAEDLIHHPGHEQWKLCKQIEPIDRWLEENYA